MESFVEGFQSVVPRSCFEYLSPKLLEGMLCGQSEIRDSDIQDLKNCLLVTNHDGIEETKLMKDNLKWFFETLLYDFNQEYR